MTNAVVGHSPRTGWPLVGDWSQHLGWFRFYFDDDRWLWSPEVEHMHGYRPKTTAPSTLLVLSHVHLDDYQAVAAGLEEARRTHRPFSSRHRIVDTRHHLHHVMMTGAPFYDLNGNLAGMQGLWLDVTAMSSTARRDGHPPSGQDDGRRQRVRDATQC